MSILITSHNTVHRNIHKKAQNKDQPFLVDHGCFSVLPRGVCWPTTLVWLQYDKTNNERLKLSSRPNLDFQVVHIITYSSHVRLLFYYIILSFFIYVGPFNFETSSMKKMSHLKKIQIIYSANEPTACMYSKHRLRSRL